jgi:tRNA-splicing ligase RtcB
LSPDVERALTRLRASHDVVAIAVMPDVHLAHDVCIGTVVATRRALYPNAVGGDIGCGMAAVRLRGAPGALDRRTAGRVLAGLSERVPVLKHRARVAPPEALSADRLSDAGLERLRDRDGLLQLGTLGRGNHFLELQRCDEGDLWLMAHSGSRGLGRAIRDFHLARCRRSSTGLDYLETGTPDGEAYLSDLRWALRYAEANRERIVGAAIEVVEAVTGARADRDSYFACHHNHVAHEDGLLLHRKGAISARDGERGIIPGSMGGPSYHVRGRGVPESLWSSSHGAGRVMSRAQARRRVSVRSLERQVRGVWFDARHAARLVDEAPAAYKDIKQVMRDQRQLTRIVRELRPELSYKGG